MFTVRTVLATELGFYCCYLDNVSYVPRFVSIQTLSLDVSITWSNRGERHETRQQGSVCLLMCLPQPLPSTCFVYIRAERTPAAAANGLTLTLTDCGVPKLSNAAIRFLLEGQRSSMPPLISAQTSGVRMSHDFFGAHLAHKLPTFYHRGQYQYTRLGAKDLACHSPPPPELLHPAVDY